MLTESRRERMLRAAARDERRIDRLCDQPTDPDPGQMEKHMSKAETHAITLTDVRDLRYLGDGRVSLSLMTEAGVLECVMSAPPLIRTIDMAGALVTKHMAEFLRDVPLFGEPPSAPSAPDRRIAAR